MSEFTYKFSEIKNYLESIRIGNQNDGYTQDQNLKNYLDSYETTIIQPYDASFNNTFFKTKNDLNTHLIMGSGKTKHVMTSSIILNHIFEHIYENVCQSMNEMYESIQDIFYGVNKTQIDETPDNKWINTLYSIKSTLTSTMNNIMEFLTSLLDYMNTAKSSIENTASQIGPLSIYLLRISDIKAVVDPLSIQGIVDLSNENNTHGNAISKILDGTYKTTNDIVKHVSDSVTSHMSTFITRVINEFNFFANELYSSNNDLDSLKTNTPESEKHNINYQFYSLTSAYIKNTFDKIITE